nr:hypothetical protein [Tanacetum cinerariifolium]
VFQLDVFFRSFTGNDDEEIVWEAANKDVDCELFDVLNVVQEEDGAPHIYLNALTDSGSTYNFRNSKTAKKLGCQSKSTYPLQDAVMVLGIQWLSALVLNMVYATLTNDAPKGLQTLLADYNDVFAIPKELPPIRSHDHRILMKEGSPTVNIRPYRHHVTKKDAIKSMVQELLDAGVIRSATDPTKIQAMKEWPAPKQAFEQLKQAMMAALALKQPNFEEGFMVETNAYGEGIGVVLQQ